MNSTVRFFSLLLVLLSIFVQKSFQVENDLHFSEELDVQDEIIEFKYPNVLSMRFHLMHSRVPKLLTKISLLEMKCPISHCSVSLIDIIDAVRLDMHEKTDITDAIRKMNVTGRDAYNMFLIYNISVPAIEKFLEKTGITFSETYKNFVESLPDAANTIPQILSIVNVSATEFLNAVAYSNDTKKLEVLSTGNYSYENVLSVLNSINKTGYDLLNTLSLNTLARNVGKFDNAELVDFVKNLGVTSDGLGHFYGHLNATSINFVVHPGFTQILDDLVSYLNPEEVLATAISATTLVTSNKAKSLTKFQSENTDFVRNYTYYQAENVQNPLIHYHVKNVVLNNTEYKASDVAFVEVYNDYKSNLSEILVKYNSSKLHNCTYVTKLPYGEFYVESFRFVNITKGCSFTLPKSNQTLFNLGSPLFCQDTLVGMASQDGPTEITFSTFLKRSGETSKPPGPVTRPPDTVPGGTTKPSAGAPICVNTVLVLIIIGLLSVWN